VTYTKLPAETLTDSSLLGLSDRAFRLHVLGLVYSNAHELDGRVPDPVLRILVRGHKAAVDELVKVGLWARGEGPEAGGYVINAFFDHQLSADELRKLRGDKSRAARTRWERTRAAYAEQVESDSNAPALQEQSGSNAGTVTVPVSVPATDRSTSFPNGKGRAPGRVAGLHSIGGTVDAAREVVR
jgi:hypothetical protein